MQNLRIAYPMMALVACLALAGCGSAGDGHKPARTHRHETAAPAPTSTVMRSSAPAAATVVPTRVPRPKSRLAACDANIRVKPATTTCGLAQSAFYEYWSARRGASGATQSLRAYSDAAGKWIELVCHRSDSIRCTAVDG